MKHKSASRQPDLFEQNRLRVLPVPSSNERLAALVEVLLLKIPGIETSSGKVVRVLGWFAGGLWCYVLARWALLAYGRDVRQLPSLIWGGLFFVALQFVVHGILQATGKPNFYSGQLPESETTVAR